jgi:hypothetical protein
VLTGDDENGDTDYMQYMMAIQTLHMSVIEQFELPVSAAEQVQDLMDECTDLLKSVSFKNRRPNRWTNWYCMGNDAVCASWWRDSVDWAWWLERWMRGMSAYGSIPTLAKTN